METRSANIRLPGACIELIARDENGINDNMSSVESTVIINTGK